ncbi:HEXXH motif-containing protein [Thermomonospora echinospora]|uniref:HEXXH motif-containing protein n=1 Tax=Thermomonospora echinospora TaxID=1992 RepID=A0A1H5ZVF3_9ACTN|nr:HEXXH motif-containing putative peptide modification protein [Thermomonospora echinospora]SEG40399.1 HEXXH motif-containing protein [Thermomonospora echinospora]
MGALAAAAAVRAGADCSVRVPVSGGRLMLPSLGLALPGGGRSSAMVRVTAEGARITSGGARITVPADPHRDAPGWRGLRRVSAVCDGLRLDLLIDDLDPYRMPALGVRDRLTAAETQDWESDLRAAWRLLVRRHPGTAAEIRGLIRVITPLAGPARGRSSASSREVHGTIALSAAGEPRALALTLAHEVQHVKLAMLLDAVALIRPGHQRRYYAPWRDDPRPIYGLLQGAYAHLGVADFWRRERRHQPHDVEPHAEFERWRSATLLACTELLRGDGLTATGTAFVNEMARTLRDWGNEPIPPHAVRLARLRAERHRTLWSRHNGAPAR